MYDELLETAIAAARAGGALLERYFGDEDLEVRRKAPNDFVTRADRDSEKAVVAEIRRRHPRHRILAEESGVVGGGEGDYQWLIDPLDGTTNFMQGLPMFCISVACRRGSELVAGVVLDPCRNDLFSAARGSGAERNGRPLRVSERRGLDGGCLATGFPFRAHAALERYLEAFHDVFLQARAIRRCGAAALDLAYTAAGVFDGFFEFRLSPWDIAAGALLIEEAGGRVSDLDGGDSYLVGGNVVAGTVGVHRELLALVQRYAREGTMAALARSPAEAAVEAAVGAPVGAEETAR